MNVSQLNFSYAPFPFQVWEDLFKLSCFAELIIWVLDCSLEITSGTFLETNLISQTKMIEKYVRKK